MAAIRLISTAACTLLLLGCVSQPIVPSGTNPGSSKVRFSSEVKDGQFSIECAPRSEAIAQNPSWVDVCNQLGRTAIEQAVDEGLIAPVEGPAFGMASEYVKDMPRDNPIFSESLGRDFPLTESPR